MASFKKLDSGKWLIKFYCKNHTGENKQIKKQGFNTKKEALEFMNNYISLHLGTENIALETLITEFLKYKSNVKINTLKKYNKNIKYIFKYFNKNIMIKDIKEKQLLNFFLSFNDTPATQKELKQFIGAIFDYAITYYNLKYNPVKKIKIEYKNTEKKTKNIYTLEDFKKLDNILKSKIYKIKTRAFFNLLYYSGARPGEIAALTLEDLDYINNTININKTRISLNVVNSPKNKSSIRLVSIPSRVMEILKEYTTQLPKIQNFYIFSNPTVYNGLLGSIIKKNNLNHITLHGFRHSHASLLIKKGIPITDISKRLGHSNPQITLSVYSHFYKDSKDNIINLLENI